MTARLPPLQRLVSLVSNRKVKTFEEACDAMSLSPKNMHKLIADARKQHYSIDIVGDTVGIRTTEPSDKVVDVKISQAGPVKQFAVISDLHFGSKYHLRKQLVDFIDNAYEQGVRNILLPGDNLDGCYRHGRWELTHHGFDDQAEDFLDGLPQKKGLSYKGITGNHDETFEKDNGMVVHKAINAMAKAMGRHDIELLGARGAYLRLKSDDNPRGVFVELWHPLKGPAYALTYKLQKHVESYAPGQKPDFLFAGHWHQSTYCIVRAVHAFSSGTFQGGGSSFAKALGGATAIGGWIVKYTCTKEGTIRDVFPQFKNYYEKEQVREVRMG